MFVRTLEELRDAGAEKVLCGGKARSVRLLTSRDGMGFSLSDVRLDPGMNTVLWYKNHCEANYILHGSGEVTDLATGDVCTMEPGMMYCVGPGDRHSMYARTDLHLLSPACVTLTVTMDFGEFAGAVGAMRPNNG